MVHRTLTIVVDSTHVVSRGVEVKLPMFRFSIFRSLTKYYESTSHRQVLRRV